MAEPQDRRDAGDNVTPPASSGPARKAAPQKGPQKTPQKAPAAKAANRTPAKKAAKKAPARNAPAKKAAPEPPVVNPGTAVQPEAVARPEPVINEPVIEAAVEQPAAEPSPESQPTTSTQDVTAQDIAAEAKSSVEQAFDPVARSGAQTSPKSTRSVLTVSASTALVVAIAVLVRRRSTRRLRRMDGNQ